MCRSVSKVHRVEMIRDGGSLAAKFTRADGASFILFLKLLQEYKRDSIIKGEFEVTKIARLGYGLPVLIDCDPAKRPPDTDGKVHSELSGPAALLTWSDARDVVREIESRVEGLGEYPSKWLQMIAFVVDNDGCLPPGIAVIVQGRRYLGHK